MVIKTKKITIKKVFKYISHFKEFVACFLELNLTMYVSLSEFNGVFCSFMFLLVR